MLLRAAGPAVRGFVRSSSAIATPRRGLHFKSAAVVASASVGLMPPLRSLCQNVTEVAAAGCRVSVDYVGKLDDGSTFDSTDGGKPIAFQLGAGGMIKGFDRAVEGMRVGETKEVRIEPADAYGERDESDNAVRTVPLDKLPPGVEVGTRLQTSTGGVAAVLALGDDGTATVDLNHPLAGKALSFTLTLRSVEPPPERFGSLKVTTLSPGDGKTYPKPSDRLKMHYTGTLAASGAKFDSSVDRGQPFEFQIGVGQVIQGWDEGVMRMSVGEKARLEIPSEMGYGARGAGGVIPPDADLVFEVELLGIN